MLIFVYLPGKFAKFQLNGQSACLAHEGVTNGNLYRQSACPLFR